MATIYSAYEVPVATQKSAVGASYTVPVNRYAIVRAEALPGSGFSIGGTLMLRSKYDASQSATFTSPSVGMSGTLVTALEPCEAQCGGICGSTGTATIEYRAGGSSTYKFVVASGAATTGFSSGIFKMMAGDTLFYANSGTGITVWAVLTPIQTDGGNVGTFKVPAGVTISGGRYFAEIYKIPGAAS